MAAAKGNPPAGTPDAAEMVGTAEAARILNVSTATLRRWVNEKRIPAQKIGKQWRIKRQDLGAAVTVQEEAPEVTSAAGSDLQQAAEALDDLLSAAGMSAEEIAAAAHGLEAQMHQPAEGDADVRRLVFKLLVHAVRLRASDLHLEPWADRLVVRSRVDGVLAPVTTLPRTVARALTIEAARLGALNTEERRRPQDGRFVVRIDGREIDFRVSTWPGVHGLVVALRILDRSVIVLSLDKLGLEAEELARWRQLIERRSGLILVTAPTGNGMTTRIYASLMHLNSPDRKIMTAEDPVEFLIGGVNQAQINPDIGFGFVQAAQAMLRQAPDVMYIGELRDRETANLAVSAALTGHLVFSTLHTNDAPLTIRRLIDMGVPRDRLASATLGIASQRLVRLICRGCSEPYMPEERILRVLGVPDDGADRTFYHGAGCPRCNGSGYRGRTAVSQLLEFTGPVREAVATQQSTQAIADAGRAAGFRTLRESALALALRGDTSPEEIIRVLD